MSAEVGPFEAFYASSLQHPILLWIAAALALVFCLNRPRLDPRVRLYCVILGVLSLLDAWLTSNAIYGVGEFSGWLASTVPLFFVLAGDYRYLLLLGIAAERGAIQIDARRLLAAAALVAIVPIFSQAVVAALPASLAGPRVLFLVYEVSFMLLTAALMVWHPGARSGSWVAPVSRFVLLYYGLWATADVIILATGSDLGYLLRVVPNVLYYGGLIAVIGWAASRAGDARGNPHDSPAR
jgi:hypothetical protein